MRFEADLASLLVVADLSTCDPFQASMADCTKGMEKGEGRSSPVAAALPVFDSLSAKMGLWEAPSQRLAFQAAIEAAWQTTWLRLRRPARWRSVGT